MHTHTRKGLELRLTSAEAEQYDVLSDGRLAGRAELRAGYFNVTYRDNGPRLVSATPEGYSVLQDDERDFYLDQAVDAIQRRLTGVDAESEACYA